MLTLLLGVLTAVFGLLSFMMIAASKSAAQEIEALILVMCAVLCLIGACLLYRLGAITNALKVSSGGNPDAALTVCPECKKLTQKASPSCVHCGNKLAQP